MKTTLAWLKTHLETDAALDELVKALVMLGLEVDGIEDRGNALAPFIVARVISAEPHPNADKLRLCVVDTGSAQVQVVCGAPNARAGMLGVFAPPGTIIPKSGLVLKQSMIRGQASNGMLVSESELGLSDDHDGIIELPEGAPLGQRFAEAAGLDDPVLDIKVTPNRGDCLGVRGIARDLAASGLGRLVSLDVSPVPGRFPCPVAVHLAGPDDKACPLFIGRVVRNLRNGPSPRWLQDRLAAIGLRPISALVDITNFVTFDLNRPLHVFDADKIASDLVVRGARKGESLAALNGRTYELDGEMTVIADDRAVLSLGGVIGGESTGCTEATRTVYLEAALFDPVRTAATGRKLQIQSDARYRFERGLDPDFTRPGIEIATRLVLELCGGEASEVAISGAVPDWRRSYSLRPSRTLSLGGVALPAAEQRRILSALGCTVGETEGALAVEPPSWRGDIEGEADLVEEVLRIHGYDRIAAAPLPRDGVLPTPALTPLQRRRALVRRTLAARGLVEAVTFSFMPRKLAELFGATPESLRIVNPISADLDQMRPSILPNLLQAAQRNAIAAKSMARCSSSGRNTATTRPTGRISSPPEYASAAPGRSAGTIPGGRSTPSSPRKTRWRRSAPPEHRRKVCSSPRKCRTGITPAAPRRSGSGPRCWAISASFIPACSRRWTSRGRRWASRSSSITCPCRAGKRGRAPLKLSPFQPVERDFAFIVEAGLPAETLLRAARGVDRKLVAEVRLFDVYTGPGSMPARSRSRSPWCCSPRRRRLTDEALEAFSHKLIAAVEKATGGSLRR